MYGGIVLPSITLRLSDDLALTADRTPDAEGSAEADEFSSAAVHTTSTRGLGTMEVLPGELIQRTMEMMPREDFQPFSEINKHVRQLVKQNPTLRQRLKERPLDSLPAELKLEIMRRMPPQDLRRFSETNKATRTLARSDSTLRLRLTGAQQAHGAMSGLERNGPLDPNSDSFNERYELLGPHMRYLEEGQADALMQGIVGIPDEQQRRTTMVLAFNGWNNLPEPQQDILLDGLQSFRNTTLAYTTAGTAGQLLLPRLTQGQQMSWVSAFAGFHDFPLGYVLHVAFDNLGSLRGEAQSQLYKRISAMRASQLQEGALAKLKPPAGQE